jgi:TPP-dependent pyruvate/acetoin dehydrogenase alpha subunit
MSLSAENLLDLYRTMLLIRRFEEMAFIKATEGMYANYHGGMGQEAIPAGVCHGLKATDKTMITHRGLGVLLARGITVEQIFAGLYAKLTSPTRGRIPVYHMGEPELGILAGTSMVGSVVPLAVGSALADQLAGNDNVTISFFGDGAVNRGDVHEGMNLACVRKLPIVFFCENNFYAKSTPLELSTAGGSIVARAQGYGIEGHLIDGNDATTVHEAAQEAIKRARAGGGPTFIECETYRWTPHSTAGDREFARTEEELAQWKAKCPIKRLEKQLLDSNQASADQLQKIDQEILAEVEQAIGFAEVAPYAPSETALENVYR